MNISLTFRYLIFSVLFFACNASALEMYASSGMMGCYEKRAWNNPSSVHACLYENYGENLYGGVHDCSVVLYDTDLGYNRYASNCYNNKGYYETYVIYERARCPSGERFNSSTIACEPQCDYGTNPDGTCMDACQFKQSIGGSVKLHWHPAVYGELVTGACYGDFGATRCEMTKNESTIICTGVPDGQYTPDSQCSLNFAYTGKQCDGGTLFWGVNGLMNLSFRQTKQKTQPMTQTIQLARLRIQVSYPMTQPTRSTPATLTQSQTLKTQKQMNRQTRQLFPQSKG
ncbi:bacteriophage f237 ORF5 [Vibrio sp. JCM 19052]|nr:bacteriophage f237 ORF5 [Vibrio sp. JCM 19052]